MPRKPDTEQSSATDLFRRAGWVLVALYVGVLAWYGARTFVDVPLIDDYAFVHRVAAIDATGTTATTGTGPGLVSYLFERHNEHLCVAARISFLWARDFLQLDFAALRWINLFLLVGVGCVAYRIIARCLADPVPASESRPGPDWVRGLLPALAFLMAASLGQWELLQLTICVGNLCSIAFSLLALATMSRFLTSSRIRWLLASVLCTLLAYWNHAAGAIAALACTLMLLAFGKRRQGLLILGLAIYSAVLLWMQFAAGSGVALSFARAFDYVEGVAAILGLAILPLADSPGAITTIQVAGYLVLLLSLGTGAWLLIRARRRREQPPDAWMALALGLISLGLISCGVTACARIDFGLSLLMAPRYYPFAMLVALGLLLALIRVTARGTGRRRRLLFLAFALVFGTGQAATTWTEMKQSRHRRIAGETMIAELRGHRDLTDARLLDLTYMREEHTVWLRESLQYLETHELSLFSEPPR